MAFGAEIKRLRLANGFSVREFAETIGVSADRLKQWELRDLTPRAHDKKIIEDFFGCLVEDIMKMDHISEPILSSFYASLGFGKALKALRCNAGISANKLATWLGVDVERLRKWEFRDSSPNKLDTRKIENYFKCSIKEVKNLSQFNFYEPDKYQVQMYNIIHEGEALRDSIKESGFTQEAAAEILSMTMQNLNLYFQKETLDADFLELIEDKLGVAISTSEGRMIGKKIKELRILKGETQTDLADAMGMRIRQIQRWEAGATPKVIALKALSTHFGFDFLVFASLSNQIPNSNNHKDEALSRELLYIIKEAGVLRVLLQRGSINTKEWDQFLAKVENLSSPPPENKKLTDNERFMQQMENLERGFSGKPKF